MRKSSGLPKPPTIPPGARRRNSRVYVPLEQNESELHDTVRAHPGNPQDIFRPVEQEIRAAWPEILVTGARTGREIVEQRPVSAANGGGAAERLRDCWPSRWRVFGLSREPGVFRQSVERGKSSCVSRQALPESTVLAVIIETRVCRWSWRARAPTRFRDLAGRGRLLSQVLYGVAPSRSRRRCGVGSALVLWHCAIVAARAGSPGQWVLLIHRQRCARRDDPILWMVTLLSRRSALRP